jgi:hypothetical protein
MSSLKGGNDLALLHFKVCKHVWLQVGAHPSLSQLVLVLKVYRAAAVAHVFLPLLALTAILLPYRLEVGAIPIAAVAHVSHVATGYDAALCYHSVSFFGCRLARTPR